MGVENIWREKVCVNFLIFEKNCFLNLHKIFLLTMVLLSWCKAFSHSAVRLKLQWWVAPCANFCSAMFMWCVIADWCKSRLLFRHKDAGSVTKLSRNPELSSNGPRLRCLHGPRSNVVWPHGIVVDRSNRPYCGTDIKPREVGGYSEVFLPIELRSNCTLLFVSRNGLLYRVQFTKTIPFCPRFYCRKQTEQSVHDRLIFGATNL